MPPDFSWGQRALKHIQSIFDLSPGGRGSATAAEARAAAYVQEQLTSLGIRAVIRQEFRGLRSIWLFLSYAYGFALIGHAAFWVLRPPLGNGAAVGVAFLAFFIGGYAMLRKTTFHDYPLRSSLPHGPSQNVVATFPAAGETRRKVVLTAHLDSHRAVWLFATDPLLLLYFASSPLGVYGLGLSPLFYALSTLTHLQLLAWIGLIPIVSHFIGWFTGVTADLGPYSPGANDNASAVGTLLSLAERLSRTPLEHTEVWLAFTGCEETGCDGMVAFLKEYGPQLKEALFVNLEEVGIGERLVYLRSEGVLLPRRIRPEVARFVEELAPDLPAPVEPVGAGGLGAFTETGVAWEYGFAGVCFMTLRQGRRWPPEWHRMTDRVDRLQPEALENAHHLAWTLLHKIDQSPE